MFETIRYSEEIKIKLPNYKEEFNLTALWKKLSTILPEEKIVLFLVFGSSLREEYIDVPRKRWLGGVKIVKCRKWANDIDFLVVVDDDNFKTQDIPNFQFKENYTYYEGDDYGGIYKTGKRIGSAHIIITSKNLLEEGMKNEDETLVNAVKYGVDPVKFSILKRI